MSVTVCDIYRCPGEKTLQRHQPAVHDAPHRHHAGQLATLSRQQARLPGLPTETASKSQSFLRRIRCAGAFSGVMRPSSRGWRSVTPHQTPRDGGFDRREVPGPAGPALAGSSTPDYIGGLSATRADLALPRRILGRYSGRRQHCPSIVPLDRDDVNVRSRSYARSSRHCCTGRLPWVWRWPARSHGSNRLLPSPRRFRRSRPRTIM